MDDIQVKDVGLYESLDFDDMGLPTGVKLDPNNIPHDVKAVYAYLRIGGKPGSYWLTIALDSASEKDHFSTLGVAEYLTLQDGVDKGLSARFNIDSVPPGHYVIKFALASTHLADFEFNTLPKKSEEE